MNFKNALACRLYPLYNQLAIHDAPLFILDLFLPILTTEKWYNVLRREMETAETFETIEDLLASLHDCRGSLQQ